MYHLWLVRQCGSLYSARVNIQVFKNGLGGGRLARQDIVGGRDAAPPKPWVLTRLEYIDSHGWTSHRWHTLIQIDMGGLWQNHWAYGLLVPEVLSAPV